ncbi:MAG: hypothetical protein OEY19_03630 [Gammaproteobacteria bacterium]|nr:hypothetical protein [Gammaproteobacteria bacterium]MDH5630319.1 hypothetical protein [Gammaproteobacteria bacterium]
MLLKKSGTQFNVDVIKSKLSEAIDRCDVMDAAAAVTIDGHLVAKIEARDCPVNRIASMGSSMMSLGDTMTAELKMGVCRNLIVENERGFLVLMHIRDDLILVTISHDKSSLGMLVSSSKICAESIRKAL